MKAEHLSQSYLEMLEDASYMNNEQSNNNVTKVDQGSNVYHTISTQTPTKSRALNDRNDTNDHNDMSLIDDDMEMQLLGMSVTSTMSALDQTSSKIQNNNLGNSKIAAADTLVIAKLKEELEDYKQRFGDAEKTIWNLEQAIHKQQQKHRSN